MQASEIRYFIFENYYTRIEFSRKNSYYSIKRLKNKDLLLLATKFTEKRYLILVMVKKTINHL